MVDKEAEGGERERDKKLWSWSCEKLAGRESKQGRVAEQLVHTNISMSIVVCIRLSTL